MTVYLIMTSCDSGAARADVDQIVETRDCARVEATDLAAIAGPVRVYEFASWDAAQNYCDEKDARWPARPARLVITRGEY